MQAASFRTVFLSPERTHYPEAAGMLAAGRRLAKHGPGSLAVRWGHRVVTTSADAALDRLTHENLVEVADFDPVRGTLLALGGVDPSPFAPVHWLVLRWRPDLHALAQVAAARTSAPKPGTLHVSDTGAGGPLELAQVALRGLKSDPAVWSERLGFLAAGRTLDEALARLDAAIRG